MRRCGRKHLDFRCNCRQKSWSSLFFKAAGKRDPKSCTKNLPGGQNDPRAPRESPGAAREAPRQELPEVPQERPRAAQSRLPSGLGGHLEPTLRPKVPRRPPGGCFGAPAKGFPTLRGLRFVNFPLSGKRLQNDPCFQADCLVGKPPPNRPTQLETLAAQARVATFPTQLSD